MDWLAELNDTIEMESWFEIQAYEAKELRDFILEKDAEIERLREALKEIAADASVAHGTDKQMWKGWRKIATTRIDIARSALQQKETE